MSNKSDFQIWLSELADLFVECCKNIENQGSKDHKKLVYQFQDNFETFLDKYKEQSIGTFAKYISKPDPEKS